MAVVSAHGVAAQQSRSDKPSVMIVFDGSGSMWGRLAGAQQAKFEIVRESLRTALAPIAGRVNLGLVIFGMSARGGCNVSEVAVAPGEDQAGEILERLDKFNPQGRGPVVRGLQTAVAALADGNGPKRIILVHDDPDNCGQDVCAALSGFQETLPGIQISAVFVAPKPEQKGHMACLAKTGGKVIEADDADAVVAAVRSLVALASSAPTVRTGPSPPANTGQRRLQEREERKPTPGLVLSAVLTEGGAPLADGVSWRVTTEAGKPAVAARQLASAQPTIALKPGQYVVEARAGTRTVRQTISVKSGDRTSFTANFDAARIVLGTALKSDSPRLPQAVFEVMPLDGADATPVWFGPAPAEPLLVAPGRYRVSVSAGRVSRQHEITLAAGQTADQRQPLSAGYLKLQTKAAVDVAQEGLVFTVAVDDPQRPSGRRVVARSAAAAPVFLLPAGTYYVSAQQGGRVAQELVGIAAGDTVTKVLALHGMALTVRHRLKGRSEPPDARVSTTIWRLDDTGGKDVVARSTEPDPTFRLAPGRYRVLSVVGDQNVRMLRQFSVGSEAAGDLVLEHVAGTLQLSLSTELRAAARTEAGGVYWRVYDRKGRVVFRSTQVAPKAVLNVGTYGVMADIGTSQIRDTVVVTSGQRVELTLRKTK
jgi:Ca-activated chloride channel homolog